MRAHAQRTTQLCARYRKNEMIPLRFPSRSLALHIEICQEFAQIRHGRIGFVALLVHVMFVEFRLQEKCQPSTVLQSWAHFPIEICILDCFSVSAMRISIFGKKNQIKMQFSSARDFQWFSSRATFRYGICSSFNLPRLPPHPNTLSKCALSALSSPAPLFYSLNI